MRQCDCPDRSDPGEPGDAHAERLDPTRGNGQRVLVGASDLEASELLATTLGLAG
jgi:hypothetical protein